VRPVAEHAVVKWRMVRAQPDGVLHKADPLGSMTATG
jgi:hypothetical protein